MIDHPFILAQMTVEIDKEIYPVVAAINKIEGVRTRYSCQGENSGDDHHRPYMSIVCADRFALDRALKFFDDGKICGPNHFEIERLKGRYYVCVRWSSHASLLQFAEVLP